MRIKVITGTNTLISEHRACPELLGDTDTRYIYYRSPCMHAHCHARSPCTQTAMPGLYARTLPHQVSMHAHCHARSPCMHTACHARSPCTHTARPGLHARTLPRRQVSMHAHCHTRSPCTHTASMHTHCHARSPCSVGPSMGDRLGTAGVVGLFFLSARLFFLIYTLKTRRKSSAVAYNHTTLNTPVLVRSMELSCVRPAQYLDV